MTFELRLSLSPTTVVATLSEPGKDDRAVGQAAVDDDPLRMATVRTLKQWLERWRLVTTVRKDFPVETTFRILGEHLFRMVFAGEVGAAFDSAYTSAREAGQPLRVRLTLDDTATELAALPWEFLYRPKARDRSGFYLATETDLVLKRYIDGPGVAVMEPVEPPLRVLVLLTVPEHDREREHLAAGLHELQNSRLAVSTVREWHDELVEQELAKDPHVVHLVGHARYKATDGPVQVEVEWPQPDGSYEYSDPEPVVELITGGKPLRRIPRLVVLHLCENEPVLFTASFERLAPAFVMAGVPAVVAMAYPLTAKAATRFSKDFYQGLAAGEDLDVVVQRVRSGTSSRLKDSRLIGTPVLYLQSESAVVVGADEREDSRVPVDRHHVRTQATASDQQLLVARLKSAAAAVVEDVGVLMQVLEWIDETSWPTAPAQVQRVIRERFAEDPDPVRQVAYLAMLKTLAPVPT